MSIRPSRLPSLGHVRVHDCMHAGILSCPGDAPLGEVAALMATHRVHAVAVTNGEGQRPVGVVSALDVVMAIASGAELTARQAGATETISISAGESLSRAAQVMAEHSVSHLVVLDAASGVPAGVISTLDIAAAYAGETRE